MSCPASSPRTAAVANHTNVRNHTRLGRRDPAGQRTRRHPAEDAHRDEVVHRAEVAAQQCDPERPERHVGLHGVQQALDEQEPDDERDPSFAPALPLPPARQQEQGDGGDDRECGRHGECTKPSAALG